MVFIHMMVTSLKWTVHLKESKRKLQVILYYIKRSESSGSHCFSTTISLLGPNVKVRELTDFAIMESV